MWYFYTVLVICILYIILIPKHISKREMYATWGIVAALGYTLDLSLGNILDLYDLGEGGVQFYDLLEDLVAGPALAIIYLNHLPQRKRDQVLYIIFWVLLSVLLEWSLVWADFERLKGWTPFYSIPIYIMVYIFLRWHINFLRHERDQF